MSKSSWPRQGRHTCLPWRRDRGFDAPSPHLRVRALSGADAR